METGLGSTGKEEERKTQYKMERLHSGGDEREGFEYHARRQKQVDVAHEKIDPYEDGLIKLTKKRINEVHKTFNIYPIITMPVISSH